MISRQANLGRGPRDPAVRGGELGEEDNGRKMDGQEMSPGVDEVSLTACQRQKE